MKSRTLLRNHFSREEYFYCYLLNFDDLVSMRCVSAFSLNKISAFYRTQSVNVLIFCSLKRKIKKKVRLFWLGKALKKKKG